MQLNLFLQIYRMNASSASVSLEIHNPEAGGILFRLFVQVRNLRTTAVERGVWFSRNARPVWEQLQTLSPLKSIQRWTIRIAATLNPSRTTVSTKVSQVFEIWSVDWRFKRVGMSRMEPDATLQGVVIEAFGGALLWTEHIRHGSGSTNLISGPGMRGL